MNKQKMMEFHQQQSIFFATMSAACASDNPDASEDYFDEAKTANKRARELHEELVAEEEARVQERLAAKTKEKMFVSIPTGGTCVGDLAVLMHCEPIKIQEVLANTLLGKDSDPLTTAQAANVATILGYDVRIADFGVSKPKTVVREPKKEQQPSRLKDRVPVTPPNTFKFSELNELQKSHLRMNVRDVLAVRGANSLEHGIVGDLEPITIVHQLVKLNESTLAQYLNMGQKTIREIKNYLSDVGLQLNMNIVGADW